MTAPRDNLLQIQQLYQMIHPRMKIRNTGLFRLTEEEKRGTIPGSTEATAMALAVSRAQANPVVERSKPQKVKKKKPAKQVQQAATQTDKPAVQPKQ